MPVKLSDEQDWSVLLLEVMDRLHLSRIHPRVCSTMCGAKSIEQKPCERHAQSHLFPVAQCILGWENEEGNDWIVEGDGLFVKVQWQLGLLQTIPLSAQFVPGSSRYNLEHLENTVGLKIPWLRPREDNNKPEFDPRRKRMNEIFRSFRRKPDVQEFASLLESPSREELRVETGPVEFINAVKLVHLSSEEKKHGFLLVSDMEQSFFSLLFVLAEANNHAKKCNVNVREWVRGEEGGQLLRSELCHMDKNLDDSRYKSCPKEFDKDTEYFRPNEKKYGDRIIDEWPDHFWRASTFEEAVHALGFIKSCRGSATKETTNRFQRLLQWLGEVTKDEEESHPALQVKVYLDDELRPLIDVLKQLPIQQYQSNPDLDKLRSLCDALIEKLSTVRIKIKTGEVRALLDSAESFSQFHDPEFGLPGLRFNVSGEYLLRKGESISRSFFATALDYATDDPSPSVGTFAVGTLLNANQFAEETVTRIRGIRALLRALVQFGVDHVMAKLLTEYAKREARALILHQLPKDMAALNEYLASFKNKLDAFRHKHSNLDVPSFAMPDAMSVMMMFMRAQVDKKLFELPPDCANMLSQSWTSEAIEQFVTRVVWPAARSRVIASPEIISRRQDSTLSWSGFNEMESKYLRPKIKIAQPFTLQHPYGLYPLVLITLRNAFEHSYRATLLSNTKEQGEVEIEYANQGEGVVIANTGDPPGDGPSDQRGWEHDLNVFEDVTGKWKLIKNSNSQYSMYDENKCRWITRIMFEQ